MSKMDKTLTPERIAELKKLEELGLLQKDIDTISEYYDEVERAQKQGCLTAGIVYCVTSLDDETLKKDFTVDENDETIIHHNRDSVADRMIMATTLPDVGRRTCELKETLGTNIAIDFVLMCADAEGARKDIVERLKKLAGNGSHEQV